MSIEIRPVTSPSELAKIEELQKRVWGMEDRDIVPVHMMVAAVMTGGLVLGVYDEENNIIGFVFGILGLREGKVIHHSHMAGVIPGLRYKGIGYKLKLAQREHVLKQGIKLIEWTFDPLRAPNAKLNFNKLGAVSQRYIEDVYGALRDRINYGVPSDRLLVDWWIASSRVVAKLKGELKTPRVNELISRGVELANEVELVKKESTIIESINNVNLKLKSKGILIRVPYDDLMLKKLDFDLYMEWRYAVRELFESYLKRGYIVVDFISEPVNGRRENFYLLIRCSLEEVLNEKSSYFNLLV